MIALSGLTPRPAAVLLLAVFAAPCALAQNTHLWTQSRYDEFEKGTPLGVAIASDGRLQVGPSVRERLTTPSTFVWSVATTADGTAYLGTAAPATVLRVGKDGKPITLLESSDISVQCVRMGPDGALYAATLPSGKVYRLDPHAAAKTDESKAAVVFDAAKLDGEKNDTKHYIWDLTFDAQGRLYVATGAPAGVWRVDLSKAGAKPEAFFKSDEQHIRSLAWDAKGSLIAGSDGSGLVYRIAPDGKGYVLFEAPRREITSVAVAADGTIYAASVGDKSHNPLPPLPVQGQASITITIVQPGSMQAANASASVPEGTELYALRDGQAPRKIWSSKDDIVYALQAEKDDVLALTGNRGRVLRVAADGSFSDVGHLEAQQGLCLAASGSELLIGTGNTGKLISLAAADKHEYASDVLDAGALARFGRVEVDPGSSSFDLLTRSGNVEQPTRGWSGWTPLRDGAVASPAGRYFQWKAVLHSGAVLGGIGVNYLPVNAAPVVDDLVVVPGARLNPQSNASQTQTIAISFPSAAQNVVMMNDGGSSSPLQAQKDRTAVTARWAAHDDNGDDLSYALYLRGDNEHAWRLLKNEITDKAYSFDAAQIPDGGYTLKVVASDAPNHTPGEALTAEKISDRFVLDTTAPVVSALSASLESAGCSNAPCKASLHATFDAEDATSPIAHAEYSIDAGPWKFVAPVGDLSDAKREHYELRVPLTDQKTGEHLITVRVYDRYENVSAARTVTAAQAK